MQKAGMGAQAPSPWMASMASRVIRGPPKPASYSFMQLSQMKSASSFVLSCAKSLMSFSERPKSCCLDVGGWPVISILAKIS
eukprot:12207668-Heterocapsa_arctica.AAC.1